MGRIFAYTTAGTIVGLAILYASFRQAGIDLLSPQVRMTALLCVVTAFYVSLRLSMLANRFLERRADAREAAETGVDAKGRGAEGSTPRANPFRRWGRSSALDARMAERRARVARARARQGAEQAPDTDSEGGPNRG